MGKETHFFPHVLANVYFIRFSCGAIREQEECSQQHILTLKSETKISRFYCQS